MKPSKLLFLSIFLIGGSLSEASLVSYWNLDGNLVDSEGNLTGQWAGPHPPYQTSTLSNPTVGGGVTLDRSDFGQSLTSLGGQGSRYQITSSAWNFSSNTDFGMMSWVLGSGINSGKNTIIGTGTVRASGFAIGINKEGENYSLFFDNKQTEKSFSIDITANYTVSEWFNFGYSYDASENAVSFFLNGTNVGTVGNIGAFDASSQIGLFSYGFNEGPQSKLTLDELKVFNSTLDSSTVLSEAHISVPEPTMTSLSLLGLVALGLRRRRA